MTLHFSKLQMNGINNSYQGGSRGGDLEIEWKFIVHQEKL
jgi:hypothetical protein